MLSPKLVDGGTIGTCQDRGTCGSPTATELPFSLSSTATTHVFGVHFADTHSACLTFCCRGERGPNVEGRVAVGQTKSCEPPVVVCMHPVLGTSYVRPSTHTARPVNGLGLFARGLMRLPLEVSRSVVGSGGKALRPRCYGFVANACAVLHKIWLGELVVTSSSRADRPSTTYMFVCVRANRHSVCRRIHHKPPVVLSYALAAVVPLCRRVCGWVCRKSLLKRLPVATVHHARHLRRIDTIG